MKQRYIIVSNLCKIRQLLATKNNQILDSNFSFTSELIAVLGCFLVDFSADFNQFIQQATGQYIRGWILSDEIACDCWCVRICGFSNSYSLRFRHFHAKTLNSEHTDFTANMSYQTVRW